MRWHLALFLVALVIVCGANEIAIFHNPPYLTRNPVKTIDGGSLSDIFGGILGTKAAAVPLFTEPNGINRPLYVVVAYLDKIDKADSIAISGQVKPFADDQTKAVECFSGIESCNLPPAPGVVFLRQHNLDAKEIKKKLKTDNFVLLGINYADVDETMSAAQVLRRKREVGAETYNLAPSYDDDYPAIFNIILWTMIILALTVFALVYSFFGMDPGKDSVLYRLTDMRVKKDQ